MRVFPISNWTELDVWQYIGRERLAVPGIYYAHLRPVIVRGAALMPVSPLVRPSDGETVVERSVRFRTVGDMTCTAPVESRRDDGRRDHRGDRGHAHHGARRDADGRPDVGRVDGAAQEGRVLLMRAIPRPVRARAAR